MFAIFKEKEALITVKKRLSTEVTFSNALILLDIENQYRFDTKNVEFLITCLKVKDYYKKKFEMQQSVCEEEGEDP